MLMLKKSKSNKKNKKTFKKPLTTRVFCAIIITERNEREDTKMINIRTLRKLQNNDGLTLKNGKAITYKSGWQVATEGIETKDQKEAMKAIKAFGGNCGIWFADGIYYIDKSKRVNTKREALAIGKACNQISILKWANMSLAYC